MLRFTAVTALVIAAAACQSSTEDSPPGPAASGPPARATDGPILVPGPAQGDIAEFVVAELARAATDGYRVVVYVGATWCEPCEQFKSAVASGALSEQFGDVRVLEFDSDRDDPRLTAAGYGSTMIPLFVSPGPDGRGTDARFAGAPKGATAVTAIAPRLAEILRRPPG